MAQNIYDNSEFFNGYATLNRSIKGLNGAPEWASLSKLLPDLKNLNIIDLGCGYGWFCRYAREQGATRITGIDVSEKMLTKARSMTSDSAITYSIADMEQLKLPESTFDLAYSSLSLHYIKNISDLIKNIYNSLTATGSFIFSVEHPIYTASISKNLDWVINKDGQKSWPINSYQNEGSRTRNWFVNGVIKQHRTMGTYLNLLIKQGFKITHVEEWGPTDEQLALYPELADELERPMLLLIAAHR